MTIRLHRNVVAGKRASPEGLSDIDFLEGKCASSYAAARVMVSIDQSPSSPIWIMHHGHVNTRSSPCLRVRRPRQTRCWFGGVGVSVVGVSLLFDPMLFLSDSSHSVCLNVRMRAPRCALLLAFFAQPLFSQQTAAAPPDILQIYTDPVKPGKLAEYSRIENEAAHACSRANTWPYLAMQAITGPQEVWFISGFDSYAAMEKSAEPFAKNASLAADMTRLMEAKTSLVSDPHTIFLRYRDDLSRSSGLVRPQTRYFSVTMTKVHAGHEHEFEESQRLIRGVRERAGSADNRVVYQVLSGIPDNTYITFSPYRTFRDVATSLDGLLDYEDLDDSVRGRLRDLLSASVQTTETFIFSVSPSMSNPEGEWIADDPEFWRSSPPLQRQAPKK